MLSVVVSDRFGMGFMMRALMWDWVVLTRVLGLGKKEVLA